ncbi:MAG: hypothetical protein R3D45_09415 [Rhizobiaceae bacterium]
MKNIVRLALVAAFLGAVPATAQMSAEVKFDPGNYGTLLSGTIRGDEYFDYRLGASGGQELFAELTVTGTNGDGTIYFNVLPPGSNDAAIYVGSNDTDRTETINLPESGEYIIRVYLLGNDRDTDKTVGYNLDISIQ